MLIALGLYVREEHRLPPQRDLHNRAFLPSFKTVVGQFGSPQAYYAALPGAWRVPLMPVGRRRVQYPTRYGICHRVRAGQIPCLRCDRLFASIDTTYNRLCGPCASGNAHEEGLWLTGEAVIVGGGFEEEVAHDD